LFLPELTVKIYKIGRKSQNDLAAGEQFRRRVVLHHGRGRAAVGKRTVDETFLPAMEGFIAFA